MLDFPPMDLSASAQDLRPLIRSCHSLIVIETPESLSPIIRRIDEIKKTMAAEGVSGKAAAGLGSRLFDTFLTWLQEKKQEVFAVGAANDLSPLPPELLRKGRFVNAR